MLRPSRPSCDKPFRSHRPTGIRMLSEEQVPHARQLPRLRRRVSSFKEGAAAKGPRGPRGGAAGENSRRRRRDRHPHARRSRGVRRHRARPQAEVQTFAVISEEIARGDSASPTRWCRTGRSPCCCATSRRATCRSSGSRAWSKDPQFLLAHCLTEPRGASDRWLPYNVPEAAMNTRAVKGKRRLGDQRPQAVHQQRLRCRALRRLRQHQTRSPACCRARRASWSRAIRRGSRSRAATRRWAAAS